MADRLNRSGFIYLATAISNVVGLPIDELGFLPFVPVLDRRKPTDDAAVDDAFLSLGLCRAHKIRKN